MEFSQATVVLKTESPNVPVRFAVGHKTVYRGRFSPDHGIEEIRHRKLLTSAVQGTQILQYTDSYLPRLVFNVHNGALATERCRL